MEEWVGRTVAPLHQSRCRRRHGGGRTLESMQRAIAMLFRAAGGPRRCGWRRPAAGAHRRAARLAAARGRHRYPRRHGLLEPEVLSLPPVIAVFDDAALNRALYLWLAALAAVHRTAVTGSADNLRASAVALTCFPDCASATRSCCRPSSRSARSGSPEGHSGQRRGMRAAGAAARAAVADGHRPVDVAPVWLWLDAGIPRLHRHRGRRPKIRGRRRRRRRARSRTAPPSFGGGAGRSAARRRS
jgi:nitric oxide reductase NorD protein